MWNNLKSKNAIVGLGAWLLSIASFTAQLWFTPKGVQLMWLSPLGMSTLIIFVLGSLLIFWGIFKKELSYPIKKAIVEKRGQNLTELKQLISERLIRLNKLSEYAVKLPLKDYFSKYLKNARRYPILSESVEILTALMENKFLHDNLYYDSLKKNDTLLRQNKTQYDVVYAEVDDKKLRRQLNELWRLEHKYTSGNIFIALSKNNPKVPNTITGYKIGRLGEDITESVFNNKVKAIIERIDMLQKGEDL